MKKLLLTVENAFEISGRGVIIAPGPLQAEYDGPRQLEVTLISPNGAEQSAILTLEHVFQSPPPKEHRWVCLLRGLTKAEVPLGAEVWLPTPRGTILPR